MRNHLARGAQGFGESELVNDVVEASLEKLKQDFTGDPALARRELEVAAELALKDAILVAKLLLFGQRQRVVGQLAAGSLRAVLAGRIVLVLERLWRSVNEHAIAAADFGLGSGISSHEDFSFVVVLRFVGSDATLFRRTATVVRHGRDVADYGDFEADGLHGADGGFAAGAGALDADFDFSETVAHGLSAGILRDHLSGVGGALARAFEAAFSSARPSDDGAFLVGDADDGVVEAGLNVRDAVGDILAALGLDDLQRFDAVVERKRDWGRSGSPSSRLSFQFSWLP